MDNYFEEFKEKMRNRMRIPNFFVDKYYDEVCFTIDTSFIYAQVVFPRIAWLRPMPYEVNVDEIIVVVIALLAKEIYAGAEKFGTYE